jgi:hypothetical protein
LRTTSTGSLSSSMSLMYAAYHRGSRDRADTRAGEAGAHLRASVLQYVFSCLCRPRSEAVQPSFDSAAPVHGLRMAGWEGRCETSERAVHPRSAFAAGSMANDRSWFHRRVVATASLYRRPSDKCFHKAPILPYFPCSPSVTRSVLIPRPSARRGSASASPPSRVSVFKKSCVQRTQKDFPNLPKKTPLGLGSGAHSRRFAQECPDGNPGKYNQGETSWHSTKTKSL